VTFLIYFPYYLAAFYWLTWLFSLVSTFVSLNDDLIEGMN
jgi:hypothetical protein